MNKLLCAVGIVVATTSVASAEPTFVNATSGQYTVVGTFPNKKVEKIELSPVGLSLSTEKFMLPPAVDKLSIVIKDDADAVAWKGTTGRDDIMLLVPDAKGGIKVVFAGLYGGSDAPRAELFMNLTGEELTLDLIGDNGIASSLGVKPPAMFDAKKPVKLDSRESRYTVSAKKKDGTEIEVEGKVNAFHYCVIWKNTNGTYSASELGTIPPPASAKKKKK